MLGRCLECAFELGPHVFPFTPSAGTAQGEHIRSGQFDDTESISWVSMLRFRLIFFLSFFLVQLLPSYSHAIARRRGKAGLPGSLGASGRMVMLCRKSEVSLSVSQRGSFSWTRAGFSACMHILRKVPSPPKVLCAHTKVR